MTGGQVTDQTTFKDWLMAKGVVRVAEALGMTTDAGLNTAYSWSSRQKIPRVVWPELLKAFPELGMNDLLAMERVSDKRADA